MRANGFASSLALLLRRIFNLSASRHAQNIWFRFARYVRLCFHCTRFRLQFQPNYWRL